MPDGNPYAVWYDVRANQWRVTFNGRSQAAGYVTRDEAIDDAWIKNLAACERISHQHLPEPHKVG